MCKDAEMHLWLVANTLPHEVKNFCVMCKCLCQVVVKLKQCGTWALTTRDVFCCMSKYCNGEKNQDRWKDKSASVNY
jgi:hypothetical protein